MKCFFKKNILTIILVFIFQAQSQAQQSCQALFSPEISKPVEVKDLKSFGQAMSEGMLLDAKQVDLFEVYRILFFGDPTTSVNEHTLKSVTDILAKNPGLRKPHFREYLISQVAKVYEKTQNLSKYLSSQIQSAGQVKEKIYQIDINLNFWKKLLDYKEEALPVHLTKVPEEFKAPPKGVSEAEFNQWRSKAKEFREKQNQQIAEIQQRQKADFEKYLNRIINKTNRTLLADLKSESIDYDKKAKALFLTLRQIQEHMEKCGRNTQSIRQAMVDLVHTVGFGNEAIKELFKSKNALDNIEGLRKALDERDRLAMELGYDGHFAELQEKLKIAVPSGLTGKESPSEKLQELEAEVLKGNYTTAPTETVRVRSLSIQEAPFRSCLGGSDCSSRTYFSKALDPNYNYFTMTDSQGHSSGHVTVVLGEAINPTTKQTEKVAFVDKLQNVPNAQIEAFLTAVSRSLKEKGYKLAIPEDVGDSHRGMSNVDTTRFYVAQNVVSRLTQKLDTFAPHAHEYNFENKYSRAYNKLPVRIYEEKSLDDNTQIVSGKLYEPNLAPKALDKNQLLSDFLKLKDSTNEQDLLKFIQSESLVDDFEKLQLYDRSKFQKDLDQIISNQNISASIRKEAYFASLMLVSSQLNSVSKAAKTIAVNDFEKTLRYLSDNFTQEQSKQIVSEIKQWSKSSNKKKKGLANFIETEWVNQSITTIDQLHKLGLIDLNKFSSDSLSLVHALKNNKSDLLDYLLSNEKVDIHQENQNGFNVIDYALALQKEKVLEKIKEKRSKEKLRIDPKKAARIFQLRMHKIEPGTFNMLGAPKPVTLTKAFELAETQTTQMQYARVQVLLGIKDASQINPAHFKTGTDALIVRLKGIEVQMKPEHPIESISYEDITTWIKGLNELSKNGDEKIQLELEEIFPGHKKGKVYDLPTEAQWAYVKQNRGKNNEVHFDRSDDSELGDYAWYDKNSNNQTHQVATKKPRLIDTDGNGRIKRFYDLEGNVWDLLKDMYNNLTGGTDPVNQQGSSHVKRGGSWLNSSWRLGTDYRDYKFGNYGYETVGFRLSRIDL